MVIVSVTLCGKSASGDGFIVYELGPFSKDRREDADVENGPETYGAPVALFSIDADRAGESGAEPRALPQFDLGIDTHTVRAGYHSEAWGKVREHRFQVSDGTMYDVNVYTPDPHQRASAVKPVTLTTPWCTPLKGFNSHVGTRFAERGMYVVAVSPEVADLPTAIRRLGKASLAHDAKVQHLILDTLEAEGEEGFREVNNIGYSRGAMVGMILQGLAKQHGRTQVYNDYIDPCLAHQITWQEVPKLGLPLYVAKELGALVIATRPAKGRMYHHLLPTLKQSPGFLVSQLSTGLALFSGEAGQYVGHMPTDSNTHVIFYGGSVFNHVKDWEEKLAPFPNVKVVRRRGMHLSGADIDVVDDARDRVLAQAA